MRTYRPKKSNVCRKCANVFNLVLLSLSVRSSKTKATPHVGRLMSRHQYYFWKPGLFYPSECDIRARPVVI